MVIGAAIAQGVGRQQHQGGAQTLAAAVDDVFGNLVYQGDLGVQARADNPVNLRHIVDDQRLKQG